MLIRACRWGRRHSSLADVQQLLLFPEFKPRPSKPFHRGLEPVQRVVDARSAAPLHVRAANSVFGLAKPLRIVPPPTIKYTASVYARKPLPKITPGKARKRTGENFQLGELHRVVGQTHHKAVLADQDVERMLELRAQGWRYMQLALEFGIPVVSVKSICSGRTRGVPVARISKGKA